MAKRVGHAMRRALVVAAAWGPFASRMELADLVGPNGSRKYGYDIVERCLRAGLLELGPVPEGRRGGGSVQLSAAGVEWMHRHG